MMEESINQRIARCRKLANLTQTEAAEKMGMKCSTYSQMERKGSINTERLLILADIFEVDPDVLLYGKERETVSNHTLDFSATSIQPGQVLMQSNNFLHNNENSKPFIASKKEENIIKIIRNLPKNVKDDIIAYIEQKYKECK